MLMDEKTGLIRNLTIREYASIKIIAAMISSKDWNSYYSDEDQKFLARKSIELAENLIEKLGE